MAKCAMSTGAQGSVSLHPSMLRVYACDTLEHPWYQDVLTTLEDGTVKRVHDDPASLVFSDGSLVTVGAQVEETLGDDSYRSLSDVRCGAGHAYSEARPYFNWDYKVPLKMCCGADGCEVMP